MRLGFNGKGRNYFDKMQALKQDILKIFLQIAVSAHCNAYFDMQINLFNNDIFEVIYSLWTK